VQIHPVSSLGLIAWQLSASKEHRMDQRSQELHLVAAYWVQVHGGQETWGAQQLNKELKNLGHGLTHIAQALSSNMNKQPKRVIQLKKSGSSQQARKTYKVTTEGIKFVQKMLAGEGVS
jgi:hypothetical protein